MREENDTDSEGGSTVKSYTVFCQDITGEGTIWIECVQATSLEHAKLVGRMECAEAWGREDIEEIHVLGVAEGDVNILYWEDQE